MKDWWKKGKSEPADVDTKYDEIYYNTGSAVSTKSETDDGNGLFNEFEDDGFPGGHVVVSPEPAQEVAKVEPILKRTFIPKTCHDSQAVVDAFKEGRVIVICVEELDRANFLRLFDYLMGAVQALDGTLKRIDRDTVVIYPYDIDEEISIDDIEEETVTPDESESDGQ